MRRPHGFVENIPNRNFNPRTPCGVRRRIAAKIKPSGRNFNPRTPCGVRPRPPRVGRVVTVFQSTHPLRGATNIVPRAMRSYTISIHAPLAGCDRARQLPALRDVAISIHAPLAGCDVSIRHLYHFAFYNFNPRTPCGVRLVKLVGIFKSAIISIHAPLAGCDGHDDPQSIVRFLFQSTHPLRGATTGTILKAGVKGISIHAPLAGCDHGGKHLFAVVLISIHAPLAGCDFQIGLCS